MEHLERCAWFLRWMLVRPKVRHYLPWGLVALMLACSVVKELSPLPESYLSNKRNVLNIPSPDPPGNTVAQALQVEVPPRLGKKGNAEGSPRRLASTSFRGTTQDEP